MLQIDPENPRPRVSAGLNCETTECRWTGQVWEGVVTPCRRGQAFLFVLAALEVATILAN